MVTKRGRTWISRGVIIAVLVLTALVGGGVWYHAAEIERVVLRPLPGADPSERFGPATNPGEVGVSYTEIILGGPAGDYPTWLIGGFSDRWVVFVHGLDGDRREALRVLPSLVSAGYPVLVVSHRNDGEGPADGKGNHTLGVTEWRDLDLAVSFAMENGASDVVLYGFGAGASVISAYLAQDTFGVIAGVVLDSPLVDATDAASEVSARRRVPELLARWARAMVTFRFGVDLAASSLLGHIDHLTVPVLLIHGEADNRHPVAATRALADALPDAVLHIVDGAGHGEAWNVDRFEYESTVREFVRDLPSAPEP
ncbi:MAG TPA: alpha/beta fold hydrolase [Acidimicrobiia bacterium]|nr:alpha/beta fold hydrolase [Acidimicrobiia bacterium]